MERHWILGKKGWFTKSHEIRAKHARSQTCVLEQGSDHQMYTLICFINRQSDKTNALQQHAYAMKTDPHGQGKSNCMVLRCCCLEASGSEVCSVIHHHQTEAVVSNNWKSAGTTMLWSTHQREDCFIQRQAKQNRMANAKGIRHHLKAAIITVVSDQTVRNQLHGFKFHTRQQICTSANC